MPVVRADSVHHAARSGRARGPASKPLERRSLPQLLLLQPEHVHAANAGQPVAVAAGAGLGAAGAHAVQGRAP
jgi:hypothetical protein